LRKEFLNIRDYANGIVTQLNKIDIWVEFDAKWAWQSFAVI